MKNFPPMYDQRWTQGPEASLLVGRVPLLDLRAADWLGQDTDAGVKDEASVTATTAQWQAAADVGFCYFPVGRAFTNTGQWQIGRMLARNPSMRWFGYWNYAHVPAVRPTGDARPVDGRRYDLLTPQRAKDVNGADLVAWPQGGDPLNPVESYWVSYVQSPSSGYSYNRELIDALHDMLIEEMNRWEHRPIGLKIDYLSVEAGGLFTWPTLNAEEDLNGNGVGYSSDPAEGPAFVASELGYIDSLRERFGTDFFLTSNGKAAQPTEDLAMAKKLDGFYLEKFPTTPFYDPHEAFDKIWSAYTGDLYRGFHGRQMPLVHTDLDAGWTETSVAADAGRVACLLFDIWYRHRPMTTGGAIEETEIVDEALDGYIAALGAPLGPATRSINGTQATYTREFQNDTVHITLDSAQIGINEVIEVAFTATPPDTSPPVFTTTPTAAGGQMSFSYAGGVANEPVVHKWWLAYGRDPDEFGAYTSTFSTAVALGSAAITSGTPTLYVKMKDAAGNESGWTNLGQITISPNIGG